MTVACIVQARIGSTRLPAKVLLPLPTGRTVLEEVLFRCRQIEGVDVVVAAIPDSAENDIVAEFAEVAAMRDASLAPVQIVRGPEHDVLARYVKAAEAVKADVIMRVTADCPLVDPDVCAQVLRDMMDEDFGYVSNVHPRSYPQGLDCEVFSIHALLMADNRATEPHQREHVTPWFTDAWPDHGFRCGSVRQDVDRSHLRWTLDTLEDYVRIWNEFEAQSRVRKAA